MEWHRWFAWYPVTHRESRKIALCVAVIYRTEMGCADDKDVQNCQLHYRQLYRVARSNCAGFVSR
jgi:hypothetical protein